MKKVYIAAPFKDKAAAIAAAPQFEEAGFTITHKWWLVEHEDNLPVEDRTAYLTEHAYLDYKGAHDADILVLIHSVKSEGKAVEQGIAIERGIPIIAIGERGYSVGMNIFHWMPNYTWVKNVEEAIDACNSKR